MEGTHVILMAVLVISVSAAIAWSRRHGRKVYDQKESLSNLGVLVGNKVLKPATRIEDIDAPSYPEGYHC